MPPTICGSAAEQLIQPARRAGHHDRHHGRLPVVWIPLATENTARAYVGLCGQVEDTGNPVPDAQLAARAVEHGVDLVSADSDFMRFPGLCWVNPLWA